MFICYICANSLENPDLLIDHLKYCHSKPTMYICKQDYCPQQFTCASSFKKHLKKQHLSTNTIFFDNCESISIDTLLCNKRCLDIVQTDNSLHTENRVNDTSEIDQSSSTILITDLKSNLKKSALKFTLALHNKSSFNRKDVLHVQEILSNTILSDIVEICKEINSFQDIKILQMTFNNILENVGDLFSFIKTEYKFFKYLTENDLFKFPTLVTINNELSEIIHCNKPTLGEQKITGVIMPISFQLKKYFELPGLLDLFKKNMLYLESKSTLENFVNGILWQRKKPKFAEKTVFPIFLYFDDFGIDNVLGPHSTSLCGAYFSIPVAPSQFLSKLQHIFLAGLLKSKDLKNFGNNYSLYKLIEEFRMLEEEGIKIQLHDGRTEKIYFSMSLIVGDNLGLNGILGFSKSFNCTFYCRLCKRSIEQMRGDCKEHENKFRNKKNYEDDVKIVPETLRIKKSGVKEDSIFNSLPNFHVTENFSFDIMHDLLEGVCHYDISKSLLYFIEKKFFTLDTFNYRMQLFNYQELHIGNRPSSINIKDLEAKHFKMTSSEMLTFCYLFTLFIGDLVPKTDSVWKCLGILFDIMDASFSHTIDDLTLIALQSLVTQHNRNYVELFHDTLKPKHHFMLHYVTTIRQSGPLKHLWSMRFEAKHQELKSFANNTKSRRNISYTICIKSALRFSNFITEDFLKKDFYFNDCGNILKIDSKPYFTDLVNMFALNKNSSILFHNTCIFKGTLYKRGFFLSFLLSLKLELYEIIDFFNIGDDCILTLQPYNIVKYDDHFKCYEVGKKIDQYVFKKIVEIECFPFHIYLVQNNKIFFKTRKLACNYV